MILGAVARMFDSGEFLLVVVAGVVTHLWSSIAFRDQPRSDACGDFDNTVALEMVETYTIHLALLRHGLDANFHLLVARSKRGTRLAGDRAERLR